MAAAHAAHARKGTGTRLSKQDADGLQGKVYIVPSSMAVSSLFHSSALRPLPSLWPARARGSATVALAAAPAPTPAASAPATAHKAGRRRKRGADEDDEGHDEQRPAASGAAAAAAAAPVAPTPAATAVASNKKRKGPAIVPAANWLALRQVCGSISTVSALATDHTCAPTQTLHGSSTSSAPPLRKKSKKTAAAAAVTPAPAAEIWFDDVPAELLARAHLPSASTAAGKSSAGTAATGAKALEAEKVLSKARQERLHLDPDDANAGRYVGMDCEMVGVGPEGRESALARVSLVNFHGHTLLDAFVAQKEAVTDYRTKWSGIRPRDLRPEQGARPIEDVAKEVADLIQDRILVGHALDNDLKALRLKHPASLTRDTAYYKPFRTVHGHRTPALKALAQEILGTIIQTGEHSSVRRQHSLLPLLMC
jgi:hypothetical protein